MKIRELLTDESKWTRGAVAIDKDGTTTHIHDRNTVSWCLFGALVKCYENLEMREEIESKIKEIIKDYYISHWNDYIATWPEVKKLINDLDI